MKKPLRVAHVARQWLVAPRLERRARRALTANRRAGRAMRRLRVGVSPDRCSALSDSASERLCLQAPDLVGAVACHAFLQRIGKLTEGMLR